MKAEKKVHLHSKVKSRVHQCSPIESALILPVLFVPAIGLLFHSQGCIDVFRYTIPAGKVTSDRLPAVVGYLKDVGLFQHITSMPVSAKAYLIRNVFGAAGCFVIMIFLLVVLLVFFSAHCSKRLPSSEEAIAENRQKSIFDC